MTQNIFQSPSSSRSLSRARSTKLRGKQLIVHLSILVLISTLLLLTTPPPVHSQQNTSPIQQQQSTSGGPTTTTTTITSTTTSSTTPVSADSNENGSGGEQWKSKIFSGQRHYPETHWAQRRYKPLLAIKDPTQQKKKPTLSTPTTAQAAQQGPDETFIDTILMAPSSNVQQKWKRMTEREIQSIIKIMTLNNIRKLNRQKAAAKRAKRQQEAEATEISFSDLGYGDDDFDSGSGDGNSGENGKKDGGKNGNGGSGGGSGDGTNEKNESKKGAYPQSAGIPSRARATIVLHHANRKWLYDMLDKVSDPDSPQYGEYWTLAQIDEMIEPPGTHVKNVLAWLNEFQSMGLEIKHISRGRDYLVIEFPADISLLLFGVKMIPFQHIETGQIVLRADRLYTVPDELAHAIAFVGDLIRFPTINTNGNSAYKSNSLLSSRNHQKQQQQQQQFAHEKKKLVNEGPLVTPDLIRQLYNMSAPFMASMRSRGTLGNSQGVVSFWGQSFGEKDLLSFWKRFNIVPTQVETRGFIDPEPYRMASGEESNLSLQYLTSIGEGVPTWFITPDGSHDGQETFLKWIVNVSQTQDSPWVHSVTYGDVEGSVSQEYALRVEDEFVKLGISGRTVLFASGDAGVGCNDARNKFVPDWPATSPSILSVGATRLNDNGDGGEEAWESSGGGFSNYFPMPSYQYRAIQQYWSYDSLPTHGFYNVSGRAYPDVSALGVNYVTTDSNLFITMDGTLASTSTMAGVLSLINSVRLNAGKSTLGFVNPLIYKKWSQVPGAFRDVTIGRNADSGSCPGFPSKPGYDPVTGFGTPDVGLLASLALLF